MSNITFVFINTVALTLILLKYYESSIINDFLDISKFIDVIPKILIPWIQNKIHFVSVLICLIRKQLNYRVEKIR